MAQKGSNKNRRFYPDNTEDHSIGHVDDLFIKYMGGTRQAARAIIGQVLLDTISLRTVNQLYRNYKDSLESKAIKLRERKNKEKLKELKNLQKISTPDKMILLKYITRVLNDWDKSAKNTKNE